MSTESTLFLTINRYQIGLSLFNYSSSFQELMYPMTISAQLPYYCYSHTLFIFSFKLSPFSGAMHHGQCFVYEFQYINCACSSSYAASCSYFVIKNVIPITLKYYKSDNLRSYLSIHDCTTHSIFNPITIHCGSTGITV